MNPLSRNKRRLSSLGLLLAFIIIVPILLAYSAGYRVDDKFQIVQTGGIFIHSDLTAARIYIDDEFVENNGVILRNTLIQNLRPNRVYTIRVEKDDYFWWTKQLIIYPNIVTEARIFMFPNKIDFVEITEFLAPNTSTTTTINKTRLPNPDYTNILLLFKTDESENTPEQNIILLEESTSTSTKLNSVTPTSTFALPEYILDLGIKNIEDKKQLRENSRIVTWIENGDIQVNWAGDDSATPFYFCDDRGCRDRILVSLDTDIREYDFFPGRNDALLVATDNDIFAVEIDDRSKQNLYHIYNGVSPEFRVVGNSVYVKEGEKLLETSF